MTTRASLGHQMKVGVFVGVGFVIVLFSLFMVGGEQFLKQHVILHAYFDHIQGLNEGSSVSLSGIRVGNIKKFVFLPDQNKIDVWLKLDKDFLPRVTEGSTAEIRTQGALGDKFIFINPGAPNGKPVSNGDRLEVAQASDIMGVLSEKGGDAAKIFDVIAEVYKMTKTINEDDRLGKIMKNLNEASQNLKETSHETKSIVGEIKEEKTGQKLASAVERIDHILTKIDRGEGTLGALINDSSLHDSLKAMMGGQDRKKSVKSLIRSSIEKSDRN
ncbi:MAG: MCE family protein [Bdellovibrio sp. CG10_big_fil_rev_8_21_14_0_10_47_8]|nr:MAG: MCE family protein [Bdellovibrio sp. CG10_big_fil_rev_8_21_14_0_10_47_8]